MCSFGLSVSLVFYDNYVFVRQHVRLLLVCVRFIQCVGRTPGAWEILVTRCVWTFCEKFRT